MNDGDDDEQKVAVGNHQQQQFKFFENQLIYLTELRNQNNERFNSRLFRPTILNFNNLADVNEKKVLLEKHQIVLNKLSQSNLDNSWKLEIDNWCNEWTMWIYRCNFFYEFIKSATKISDFMVVNPDFIRHNKSIGSLFTNHLSLIDGYIKYLNELDKKWGEDKKFVEVKWMNESTQDYLKSLSLQTLFNFVPNIIKERTAIYETFLNSEQKELIIILSRLNYINSQIDLDIMPKMDSDKAIKLGQAYQARLAEAVTAAQAECEQKTDQAVRAARDEEQKPAREAAGRERQEEALRQSERERQEAEQARQEEARRQRQEDARRQEEARRQADAARRRQQQGYQQGYQQRQQQQQEQKQPERGYPIYDKIKAESDKQFFMSLPDNIKIELQELDNKRGEDKNTFMKKMKLKYHPDKHMKDGRIDPFYNSLTVLMNSIKDGFKEAGGGKKNTKKNNQIKRKIKKQTKSKSKKNIKK